MSEHYLAKPRNLLLYSLCIIALATVAYQYLDIPIAEWGYYTTREHPYHLLWQYATYLQPLYFILSPWFVFFIAFQIYRDKPVCPWQKVVCLMIFSMAVTMFFNEQLRSVFGRPWPATWFHGNPSWIENKVYGFTWFKTAHEYRSFPSGHTALIFGFTMPLWWLTKNIKVRLFVIVNCLLVASGLILMCYHYFSDVLIGSLVGTLVSYIIVYKAHYLNLFKDV